MRRLRESLLLAVLIGLMGTLFGLEAQSQEFSWTSFESFQIAAVPAGSFQLRHIDPLGNHWGPSPPNELNNPAVQDEDSRWPTCVMAFTGTGGLLYGLFATSLAGYGAIPLGVGVGALAGLVVGLPVCAIVT